MKEGLALGSKEVKRVQGLFDNMGLLKGWKAISSYLHCSVCTAKRWQKHYGLPILWTATGRPMALKYELELYHALISQSIDEKERELDDQKKG